MTGGGGGGGASSGVGPTGGTETLSVVSTAAGGSPKDLVGSTLGIESAVVGERGERGDSGDGKPSSLLSLSDPPSGLGTIPLSCLTWLRNAWRGRILISATVLRLRQHVCTRATKSDAYRLPKRREAIPAILNCLFFVVAAVFRACQRLYFFFYLW